MRNSAILLILFFANTSIFAQTYMKIRKTDNSVTSILVSEIDSVYFEQNTSFSCGGIVYDYDGNSYNSIEIGNQCWLAKNLKVTHYPNGDAIPLVTGNTNWSSLDNDNIADAYCIYNNNANNEIDTYGALYTYAAAIGDDWTKDNNENQGVCPDGWHLPNNTEWDELSSFLGTNNSSKMAGNGALWADGPLDQNANFGSSGFDALPGGQRYYGFGEYLYESEIGFWWSSVETISADAYFYSIGYDNTDLGSFSYKKSHGYSVRCIKD